VAVLFGGRSGEHPISCVTASTVLGAIDRERFDVVAIGVTRDGSWTLVSDNPADWQVSPDGTFPEVRQTDTEVLLPRSTASRRLRLIRNGTVHDGGPIDLIFPLLHGTWGEDGTVQGEFELIDLPYVGAGVLASASAMDKTAAKLRLLAAGLPVAPYLEVDSRTWRPTPQALDDVATHLGWPVFVKPARAGSSLGIARVAEPSGLGEAVAQAGQHDPRVLLEAEMPGREIECGVLGGRDGSGPRAAGPGEIVVQGNHEFYDFDAKYTDPDGVRLVCPADLPEHIAEAARTMSVQSFEALGCEGLARVDFFYNPDAPAGAQLTVNEINTMPGLTQFSMFPLVWQAAGMPYATLVEDLIHQAQTRPPGPRPPPGLRGRVCVLGALPCLGG
jgi:D-alanine-D-alanine ligase